MSGSRCRGTLAQVFRVESIPMVLATAKGKRWMVRQLDVHITLLSAVVENEV